MTNKKISGLEIGVIVYCLVRSFVIGISFNGLINNTKQDSWIIPIIGIFIGIIYLNILKKIINYQPQNSINGKIKSLFGTKFGFAINFFTTFLVFIFCILNFLNLTNLIHTQFLNNTPIYIITLMFIITTIYILNKGINVITRTSIIIFYISLSLFFISLLGLIPTIEINNLKPFFQSTTHEYFNSILTFYCYNISPLFIISIIPKSKIQSKNIHKTIKTFFIISCINVFCVFFFTLGTFGYELTQIYEFPEFHILKHISFLGLTSRIESILVIQWIFDLFIYSTFLIYYICQSIKENFNLKNSKYINYIICIIIFIIIIRLSKYNIFLYHFINKYITLPLTLSTISIFIIIILKIKISK